MIKAYVLRPLANLKANIKIAFNEHLKRLNEIKKDLSDEKAKLNINKNKYFNFPNQKDNINPKKKK